MAWHTIWIRDQRLDYVDDASETATLSDEHLGAIARTVDKIRSRRAHHEAIAPDRQGIPR